MTWLDNHPRVADLREAPAQTGPAPPTRSGRSRRLGIVTVVAVALAAGLIGWTATGWIKSPADVLAESRPPQPALLTEAVQKRKLRQSISTRGTVAPEDGQDVGAVPTSDPRVAVSVFTKLTVRRGSTLTTGRLVFEVSGRPTFVMAGRVPAYRALRRGDSGSDVAQLQGGLMALGFTIRDRPGFLGSSTAAAVKVFYGRAGYPPLHDARRATLVVPYGEVAFVRSLPATVSRVTARVGDDASGTALSLAMGRPQVIARVAPGDAALIDIGDRAEVAFGGHRPLSGVVERITRRPPPPVEGGRRLAGNRYAFVRLKSALPTAALGRDVRVSLITGSTRGPVLVVPVAAVQSSADGGQYVTVTDARGSQRTVTVETGMQSEGWVEVSGVGIAREDLVVTGTAGTP